MTMISNKFQNYFTDYELIFEYLNLHILSKIKYYFRQQYYTYTDIKPVQNFLKGLTRCVIDNFNDDLMSMLAVLFIQSVGTSTR